MTFDGAPLVRWLGGNVGSDNLSSIDSLLKFSGFLEGNGEGERDFETSDVTDTSLRHGNGAHFRRRCRHLALPGGGEFRPSFQPSEKHRHFTNGREYPRTIQGRILLNACYVHINLDLEEVAAEQLFRLNSDSPSDCLILSNMHVRAQRWDDVARLRREIVGKRLDTNSWI